MLCSRQADFAISVSRWVGELVTVKASHARHSQWTLSEAAKMLGRMVLTVLQAAVANRHLRLLGRGTVGVY